MSGGVFSRPSLSGWHVASSLIMGITGALSRLFIHRLNRTQVYGLEKFLKILDSRIDPAKRQRGLLTVSNHLSVLDDPLIWGVLPFRYHFKSWNHRWALGSHDICFQTRFTTRFFALGQVLPTHRLAHAHPLGGPFQPTLVESIRLLSACPYPRFTIARTGRSSESPPHAGDPRIYAYPPLPIHPSTLAHNRYSWLHVFPEGRIHQPDCNAKSQTIKMTHEQDPYTLLPLKWGLSRLLLETCANPPLVVPIFIEGFDQLMREDRAWPRWLPRAGKSLVVVFGDPIDDSKFVHLRERWKRLVEYSTLDSRAAEQQHDGNAPGILSEELMFGEDAVALRVACMRVVRQELLALRRGRGWSEETSGADIGADIGSQGLDEGSENV